MKYFNKSSLVLSLCFISGLSRAQEGAAAVAENTPTMNSGDMAWILTSTTLVLLMTIPGLALFYAGMVRRKNVLATMMQSFAITALVSVLWIVIGYSLAFGSGNAYIGDTSKFMLSSINLTDLEGTFTEHLWVVFQMTFAIISAALITGAVAERMKFSALLWFIGLWVLLVYAPVCHWVWGGGFLSNDGVLDFAGGTVVHINAGVAGLVAAIVLGPRKGYEKVNMSPHNLGLAVIGSSLLWVGWFGFNGGSAGAANANAAMAILVTQVATAAAVLGWMFTEWVLRGKPSVLGAISGAIAGLVAITPAAGYVLPSGALVIGLLAGILCFFAAVYLKKLLKYDDSLDAFGVHGIGGLVGALLTGVFATSLVDPEASGLLEGSAGQVWTQLVGCIATIFWSALISFILLKVIDWTIGLRVTADQEEEGLDLSQHGERLD